jgi:hypothetical protein
MPLPVLTKKPGQTVTIGKDILIRMVKLQRERDRSSTLWSKSAVIPDES